MKITAEMSPNVRYAKAQEASGLRPDDHVVLPGVLPYSLYLRRRATWDKIRQSIGLDGEFYIGDQLFLFPKEWLDNAKLLHRQLLERGIKRTAKAIGIDPAEGGDKTAMAAVDEFGLLDLVSRKTPDTSVITSEALGFMQYHKVDPAYVVFDRGGGGKQHADRLRSMGYPVTTVAFGEAIALDIKRAKIRDPFNVRLEQREDRYTYINRRAEMYGELSMRLDPSGDSKGWAIPDPNSLNLLNAEAYNELFRQLGVFAREYDAEGRLMLPPKNRKPGQDENKRKTLTELLGRSPDEADAVAMAEWGRVHAKKRPVAGGIV